MPAGEPGGPDSEVFYEFTSVKHDPAFGKHCHPNCDCGRFLEIGNSVFMEYVKQENGSFKSLPAKNVDFGGGFERILAASYDDPDVFKTDLFWPVIEVLEELTGLKYEDQLPRFQPEQPPRLFEVEPRRIRESFRVIADHMKASVIMASQGLEPGNKQQGYVLRRLLRRAAVKLRRISFSYQGEVRPARRSLGEGRWAHFDSIKQIVEAVIGVYEGVYLSEKKDLERINGVIGREFVKFERTLENGLKIIEKQDVKEIGGKTAFDLWQTYGFPFELTRELVEERGGVLDKSEFDLEFIKHQEKSRTASESVFRGGLADHSENVIKYHTATHLLHAALRKVLGEQVRQRGSNITGGRLRFDFSYGEKVGEKELEEVEKLVNEQIEADLPVSFETMTYDQAIKQGALAFYGEKYPKKVKVYTVGPKREVQGQSPEPADGSPEPASVFSREICGGPHVEHTGVIGKIDIFKETSAGAGVRRIYTRMVE
jgi:alanyl-tRNA synthetase